VHWRRDYPHYDQATKMNIYRDYRLYDDATKGVAIVDLDGSITGQCGATIIGTSPHLRDMTAGCKEEVGWNAWVCGPEVKHQVCRFIVVVVVVVVLRIDSFSVARCFFARKGSIVSYSQRKRTNGVGLVTRRRIRKVVGSFDQSADVEQRRCRRRAQRRFVSSLFWSEYFGQLRLPLASRRWRLNDSRSLIYYVCQLLLLCYNSHAHTHRTQFSTQVLQMNPGEIVRLAIPYPAGTTFTVRRQYDSATTASAADIDSLSVAAPWVFVDGLLWLHFQVDELYWDLRGNHASYPQQSQYSRFVVEASQTSNSGGAAALTRAKANGKAMAGAVGRDALPLCGDKGPAPVNGVVSFTPLNDKELPVFDDKVRTLRRRSVLRSSSHTLLLSSSLWDFGAIGIKIVLRAAK
jgi:hypothetical protein